MGLLYLFLFALLFLAGFIVLYHFFGKTIAFCYGIGGAVNANFFNIGNYPILVGDFIFGYDAVLYTIFCFMVIFLLFESGEKDAKDLEFSAIGAIIFLSVVQLFASIVSSESNIIFGYGSYFASIVATYACIEISLFIMKKMQDYSSYFKMFVFLLTTTVINSLLYFALVSLLRGELGKQFLMEFLSSILLKISTIALCILCYYVLKLLQKKFKRA